MAALSYGTGLSPGIALQWRNSGKSIDREPCRCFHIKTRERASQARPSIVTVRSAATVDRANNPQGVDWSRAEEGVLIVGAGIAGLASAAALHKVGIPSMIVERDPGPRREGSAIALWTNAFRALDALGVSESLRAAHPLIERVQIATPEGKLLRGFRLEECAGGQHELRGVLRSSLLEALEKSIPEGSIAYNSPISSLENTDQGPVAILENGQKIRARAILGADGTRSSVASALDLPAANYAGYSAYRGVAEFDGQLPIPQDMVRQILGGEVRAGLYSLSPTSIYWFVTVPGPASPTPPREEYREQASRLVKGWKGGIVEAVNNTPIESINRNRIVDRWLLPGKPYGQGQITLAGDAVHPMTPNLGQGGCTALEDAVVLAQTLRAAASSSTQSFKGLPAAVITQALREYEKKRLLRVTKITVRSNLMGVALGSTFAPIRVARELVLKSGVFINSFMNHTTYDCGQL